MKLRLQNKLRAAIVAALASVSFTTLSTGSQAQADEVTTTLVTTFSGCNQSSIDNVTTQNGYTDAEAVTPSSSITALTTCASTVTDINIKNTSFQGQPGPCTDTTFLSPDSNVGNASGWMLTLTYTDISAIQKVTGMSLSVGLYSNDGRWQSSDASWPGNETFTAQVTAHDATGQAIGNAATYSGKLFGPDEQHKGKGSEKFAVTLSGTELDLTDAVSFTVVISAPGNTMEGGCFMGLQNIGYSVTATLPEIVASTWHGTPTQYDWHDSVWNSGESFVPNNDAIFDSSSGYGEVTISDNQTAHDITVSGKDYTFNIQNGGSLTATNFAVAGGNQTVNLNGGSLTPGNVTIATGASLSITGSGDMSISSLAGEGGLNKNGSGTLSISGHDSFSGAITVNAGKLTLSTMGAGTYSVDSGATIEVINANMASVGALTVTGDGTVRLVTTSRSENSNALGTLSAANLKLADNSDHSGRYYYGSSSDLSGVDHLYFDGGQLWLTGAAMTFAGAVTFNATTYTENNQPILAGAVMRLDKNATFSGAVEVAQTTKLAFAADGTVVTFGGNVTGSGQLDLKSWSNKTGTFKVSGNASTYTGAITTDSNITLAVEQNGQLALGDNSTLNGAVTLAGALTVNGSATVNGTLTQTGGSITVNEGKSLTLGNASLTSAISSTGTVVFTQNITADGLQKVGEDDTYAVGADGTRATDGNYFNGTRTESTIRVVTGGTVTTGGHTVTQDGVAYALKTDGTATGVTADEVNYSAFYQGQAGTTVTVSDLATTAEAQGVELRAVYSIGAYENPTVLNVDRNLVTAQVAFSTVNIASGVEYTGDLLIFGGMNTVSGQIGTDRLGFYGGNASVTTFTDAPVVDSGVRFTSDAELGGVQVQANQRSGDAQNYYYEYFIGDASYSVVASELSKEGEGAATVANSLMVQRVHNSEESSTGKLTHSAGAVNMSLQEVVATSGDIEFLNMAAANGTQEGKQTSVYLNNLEIGSEMTVSFYEAAAPSYEGEVVDETAVTVTGTLTACLDATLNADLVLGKKTPEGAVAVLDVSAMEGIGGLNMGSTVTLKAGELSLSDADMAMVLALDPNDMYDLFNGVDRFFVGTNVYSQIGISDAWVNARDVFANDFGEKDYYLFYSGETTTGGNGNNVGTIYIMQLPEPTTGTLSLLALAALAARRRKH